MEAFYDQKMELMGQKLDFCLSDDHRSFLDDFVLEHGVNSESLTNCGGGLFADLCQVQGMQVATKDADSGDPFRSEAIVEQGLPFETEMPTLHDVLEGVCYSKDYPTTVEEVAWSPASTASKEDIFEVGSPRTVAALEELLDLSNFLQSPSETDRSPSPVDYGHDSFSYSDSSVSPPPSSPDSAKAISTASEVEPSHLNGNITEVSRLAQSRAKPYERPSAKKGKSEEQRSRKRQQNRDAAIRYRNKKKDELGTLLAEADKLEATNKELRGQVLTVSKEIDYLKNLMLDVIKARLGRNGELGLGS